MIWIIGFIAFTLVPLIQTFQYSLNQVTVTATGIQMVPVQWKNYSRALFTDPTFVSLLVEYAIENAGIGPIVIIFSMIIALFLNMKVQA